MNKPDIFIVGAAKSGTTSLYKYLKEHSQVFMSPMKEPNFFTYDKIEAQELYYNVENITTEASYLKLFTNMGKGQKGGEASVSYLFYPGTAKRIHDFNEEAKIIIILRNPIDRGYSHYIMDKRLGYVNEPFNKIIHKTSKHRNAKLYYQQYVELGLYYNQVKEYVDVFSEDNIRIYLMDELKSDPKKLIEQIYTFLGINANDLPDEFKKHNTSTTSRNKLIEWLYKKPQLRKFIRSFSNKKMRSFIKKIGFKKDETSTLDKNEIEFLTSLYKEDLIQLEKLIAKDLTSWYE